MTDLPELLAGGNHPDDEAILELMKVDELGEPTTIWEALEERGWVPKDPRGVPAGGIPGALRSLVYDLAWMHVYLHCADHLSDEELYEDLYDLLLDYPVSIWPDDSESAISIHLALGEWDEGVTWLRYYACDFDRRMWAKTYPNMWIPPAQLPLYRRDWLPIRPE